jgi:hypothetical protein
MREVRRAGSDPAFLLKALSEASGEMQRAFYGLNRRDLLRPGEGFDDCWCLLSIAVHLRDTERAVLEQLETMLTRREPEIRHVDMDALPLEDDYRDADEEEVLEEFQYYRRQSSYMLWDLMPGEWERGGLHPYRGRLTVLEIARELYQHDLEHLWQVRRMIDARAGARG